MSPPATIDAVIPCLNEALAIGDVVSRLRAELPSARVIVVDNGSHDDTVRVAEAAGAEVLHERRRGKGAALCRGFAASRADHVLYMDGDGTYDPRECQRLLSAARAGADLVVGVRRPRPGSRPYPPMHALGNQLFNVLALAAFGVRTKDFLSGYRVLSRRFLDRCPLTTRGFEIDAEQTVLATLEGLRIAEVSVSYGDRKKGSASKLRTFRDAAHIVRSLAPLVMRRL